MKKTLFKCALVLALCLLVLLTASAGFAATELDILYFMGSPYVSPDVPLPLFYTMYYDSPFGEDRNTIGGVVAVGDGLTYQWYVNDSQDESEYRLATDNTGPNYIDTLTVDDPYRLVYCVVTDKYGNSMKTKACVLYLRVQPVVDISEKNLVSLPYLRIEGESNLTIFYEAGAPVTLKVDAEGMEPLTYEWYYQDTPGSAYKKTNSFKGNTYTLSMTSARSGRSVFCRVTDAMGNSADTDIYTMKLDTVKITKQPVSVNVKPGEKATVTVAASGKGTLKYEWYYKDPGMDKFVKTDSFKGKTYSVTMNSARSGRQIRCCVTDSTGSYEYSDTVTITMDTNLKITKQPESVKVLKNKTATVSFSATGEGLKYTWYYKDKGSSTFRKTTTFTGNTYSVNMTSARDGRQVYCVVSDKYGLKIKSDTVTLEMGQPVKITSQSGDREAMQLGETLSVYVRAEGDGLTYTWYYKDRTNNLFHKTSTFTGNTYTIKMTEARLNRQVYCVVTDQYGKKVKSDVMTLSCYGLCEFDYLYQSTYTLYGDVFINIHAFFAGEDVTYAWYYKDKGMSDFVLDSSETYSTYTYHFNEKTEGRTVYCVATDKYGISDKSYEYTPKLQ